MHKLLTRILLFTVFAIPSFAQPVRTFVSTAGSDANDCSRPAPCRNFAAGINAVAEGGEVVALDFGGYGPVFVSKPVVLLAAEGVHAAIAPTSGTAISIGPDVNGLVILRNLYLSSQGAVIGVQSNTRAPLQLERLVVRGFTSYGVRSHSYNLAVTEGVFTSNGIGISASPVVAGEIARIMVSRSAFHGNSRGVELFGGVKATVADTIAAGGGEGFSAAVHVGQHAEMNLERCTAAFNSSGINAFVFSGETTAGILIRVSNSTITLNSTGIAITENSCTDCVEILSRLNNTVTENGTDGSFTGSYTAR